MALFANLAHCSRCYGVYRVSKARATQRVNAKAGGEGSGKQGGREVRQTSALDCKSNRCALHVCVWVCACVCLPK